MKLTPIERMLSIQKKDNLLLVCDMKETFEIAQTHTEKVKLFYIFG
jgi:hypothetical protein